MKEQSLATKCVHAGFDNDPQTGAVTPPIYQTSTYAQDGPGKHRGYEYSRTHNPTREALEAKLAALENASHGISFASGCAASTAVMLCLKAGDHIIAMEDGYGGTHRLFTKVLSHFDLAFDFVDLRNSDNLYEAIKSSTSLVWIETPTNPMMSLVDIEAISQICKKKNLTLVVDNTFASPILQNPLDLGADIVTHSTSKYISGHSDVVGGFLATNDKTWHEKLHFVMNSSGSMPGPWDAYLTLRGCKTLELRVKRQVENAKIVAAFLSTQPNVEAVHYPGLESHPQHELAQKQMKDFGGMVSFEIKGALKAANTFMQATKIFTCAESLGGCESLANHPAIMTHAAVPEDHRKKLGIHDGLIRLSIGIESADDLVSDLEQALSQA